LTVSDETKRSTSNAQHPTLQGRMLQGQLNDAWALMVAEAFSLIERWTLNVER
jgi:hypothetical protein